MAKAKIVILLGIILLVGCFQQPDLAITAQATDTLLATNLETPSRILSPALLETLTPTTVSTTPTILTTSPTPVPPPFTPTIPPEARLKYESLKILPSLPASADLRGAFVLVSPYRYLSDVQGVHTQNQIILWNAERGEKNELLSNGEYVVLLSISPDRKWLAYLKFDLLQNNTKEFSTVITSADGQKQATIPWEKQWGNLSIWLDNQSLIIGRAPEAPNRNTFTALLVLNPFTGERRELPANPEDINTLYMNPLWEEVTMTSYDPMLTRRVYPSENDELVLEDLENNRILTHFLAPIDYAVPRWSPNGQEFVISSVQDYGGGLPNKFELFSITKDGQITQLTNLASYYQKTFISDYTWSPDGKKIAFWLATSQGQGGNLAILDMTTQEVTQYNIKSGSGLLNWSPDGKQILTGITDEQGEHAIVVDLVNGWAAPVADDMAPVGWLVNEE